MKVRCFREILKQAKKEEKMRIYNDTFYTKTETDGFDYKLKVLVSFHCGRYFASSASSQSS